MERKITVNGIFFRCGFYTFENEIYFSKMIWFSGIPEKQDILHILIYIEIRRYSEKVQVICNISFQNQKKIFWNSRDNFIGIVQINTNLKGEGVKI